MTWGAFKRAVDAAGVSDDERIAFIDFTGEPWPTAMYRDPDGVTICAASDDTDKAETILKW